jgi:hypothetical protein
MEAKLPDGYRVQDGCHNCASVFVQYDFEDERGYFCTFGAPTRPPCGSVAMHETWSFEEGVFEAAMHAWDEWADPREVAREGTCNRWMPKEPHVTP